LSLYSQKFINRTIQYHSHRLNLCSSTKDLLLSPRSISIIITSYQITINMTDKNLPTAQKPVAATAKDKTLPTRSAAPHSSSTQRQGETTKTAARTNVGHSTNPARSTTTPGPQKSLSGDRSKGQTTVAHAAHSLNQSGSQTGSAGNGKSVITEIPDYVGPVVKVGLTERYWDPSESPFAKEPAVMPNGRLFWLKRPALDRRSHDLSVACFYKLARWYWNDTVKHWSMYLGTGYYNPSLNTALVQSYSHPVN
jgi:hypothetical protein